MHRRLISLGLVVLLALALAACASIPPVTQPSPAASPVSPQAAGEDTVLLTDQAGNQVTIKQPVQHIVSTYGMATLYVYALGAGDRFASATFLMSKDAQIKAKLGQLKPDATTLPDPGGQQDANIEEIAVANPDLILISARAAGQDTLKALNVPILRYEGETTAKLKEALTLTGQALGPEAAARAARLVATMDERLAAIKAVSDQTPVGQRKRVFISGTSPLKTAGKEMLQSEMVALASGVAAINSLLDVDESRAVEVNAARVLAERGRGRNVALVGHFPFIPRLREQVGQLWVSAQPPSGSSSGRPRAGIPPRPQPT